VPRHPFAVGKRLLGGAASRLARHDFVKFGMTFSLRCSAPHQHRMMVTV
jgi:hypothetical protein